MGDARARSLPRLRRPNRRDRMRSRRHAQGGDRRLRCRAAGSPPVTPGTQWVTVGGAVANDVHGKNHHRNGCFGDHVESLTLLRTDGSRIVCGPGLEPEWFRATVGGLGLTGLIVAAKFRLRPVAGAVDRMRATRVPQPRAVLRALGRIDQGVGVHRLVDRLRQSARRRAPGHLLRRQPCRLGR